MATHCEACSGATDWLPEREGSDLLIAVPCPGLPASGEGLREALADALEALGDDTRWFVIREHTGASEERARSLERSLERARALLAAAPATMPPPAGGDSPNRDPAKALRERGYQRTNDPRSTPPPAGPAEREP